MPRTSVMPQRSASVRIPGTRRTCSKNADALEVLADIEARQEAPSIRKPGLYGRHC